MEAQLQDLIDKIKTDGVAEAEKQAAGIVAEAEAKAKKTVADAEQEAAGIIENGKKQAAQSQAAGEKALQHAGRDLILSLQKEVIALFDSILQKEVADALTPETMGNILEKMIGGWKAGDSGDPDLEVLLDKKDAETIQGGIIKKLQKQAKAGIVIKPVATVDAGFQIGEKDASVHYDFSDKGLTEMLAQYLNQKLAEILKAG